MDGVLAVCILGRGNGPNYSRIHINRRSPSYAGRKPVFEIVKSRSLKSFETKSERNRRQCYCSTKRRPTHRIKDAKRVDEDNNRYGPFVCLPFTAVAVSIVTIVVAVWRTSRSPADTIGLLGNEYVFNAR